MLAINDVAYSMHVWRNVMEVFESSASETIIQGGDGVEQNTISDTTLRKASEKCTMNASTCSFGLLDRYLDAMQRCLVKGAIQLRRPSGSTAPDVEEMILTLMDLVDMDADHRATMSRSEFCSIFSLLHTSVLPIVPQVTHQKDKSTMTIHMDEQEIKGNVQRCPYFRPQSEILNYQDTRRRNVEGFVENLKTREWEDFLNGLKGGQARAAKKAAAAGGTKWVEFLRDHIATEEQSPLIALLSPTSVVKPFNDSFIDSLRLLATEAETLATDATRATEAIKPIAAELAVTKNNAHKAMTYMNRDVMLHAADAAATAAAR